MFCSICLNNCTKYQKIPCGHQACLKCMSDYTRLNKIYQCPICFTTFELEAVLGQHKNAILSNPIMIYCIQCEQSYSLDKIKQGIHRNHTIELLDKYFPKIKEKALEKLNKGLTIQSILLLKTQKEADEPYFQKIRDLFYQIQSFFCGEKESIVQRQRKLLQQVKQIQQKVTIYLELKRQKYINLYEQMHFINEELQCFIQDKIHLEAINKLGILKYAQQQTIVSKIKSLDKENYQIPSLICPKSISRALQSYCFLKYPQNTLTQSQQQKQQKTFAKRIDLRSKIMRRMNCL